MIRWLLVLSVLLWAVPASAQNYRFPTTAADYSDWYPTAYKDEGGQDWNCGSIYYSGHGGSDFGGGSWAGMEEGREVVAAAAGTVQVVEDGWPDDCSTADCPGGGGFGNHVALLHADGRRTYYAHLKTWSIPVSVGDSVDCGDALGQMGSSGHSTGPHLHFELRENGTSGSFYSGDRTDPFAGACSPVAATSFTDQGQHGALPGLTCDGDAPCTAVGDLLCGQTITANNGGAGSTSSSISYSCTEFFYSGPETAWSWTAAVSESVTVSVAGLSADLDLFVTDGASCAPTACLGGSTTSQTSDESVTFDAVAGQAYTVIVDGWEGATSDLSLTLDCTPEAGDDDDSTDPGDDDDSGDDDDAGDDDSAGDDDDTIGSGSPSFPGATRLSGEEDGQGCRSDVGGRGPVGLWLVLLLAYCSRAMRRSRSPSAGTTSCT